MNYNEMSAAQCADWLAEKDGGTWRPYAGDEHWRLWTLAAKNAEQFDHPYPQTLDAAAGALREPWKLAKTCRIDGLYNCTVWRNAGSICTIEDAPDELTARYRAAVAARMEDDDAK